MGDIVSTVITRSSATILAAACVRVWVPKLMMGSFARSCWMADRSPKPNSARRVFLARQQIEQIGYDRRERLHRRREELFFSTQSLGAVESLGFR